jgi:Ca2+-binding RTX toxin-like protein
VNLRRTALALVLGTCVMTLLPSGTARAASICHEQPATIEASSGDVEGTPGDDVIVVSGTVRSVGADEGDDLICLLDTVKLGGGHASLWIVAGAGDDVIDTSAAGAKSYTILGAGSDTFLGGPFHDSVNVGASGGSDSEQVSTGAGKDSLSVSDVDPGPAGTFDLGAGRDSVYVADDYEFPGATGDLSLVVDLVAESMTWRGVTAVLRDTENFSGLARRIVVRGNAEDNRVVTTGCQVTLKGGKGDDRLSIRTSRFLDEQPFTCRAGDLWRAFGNGGDDHLRGGRQHDVLIGGPGRDVADGWSGGHDRCVAERLKGWGCGVS